MRKKRLESLLQENRETTRSKTEMVPDQIITQDFSNQYCVNRNFNEHCRRCIVQFL